MRRKDAKKTEGKKEVVRGGIHGYMLRPKFNTALYAATFSFCDTSEKRRIFAALVQAWRWGTCDSSPTAEDKTGMLKQP